MSPRAERIGRMVLPLPLGVAAGCAGDGGRASADRSMFEAGYGRACDAPATYSVQSRGGRAAFEAVGADPCPLRRDVLTSATWERVAQP